MHPPGALFFDLDSTLVYLDTQAMLAKMTRVCAYIAERHGVDATALLDHHRRLTLDLWSRAESGTMSGKAVMRENWLRALAACGCDAEDAADSAADLYWDDRQGIICLFHDTLSTLDALRGRLPLAVITNGPADTQLDKLCVNGCDSHFDLVLASSVLGVSKPDPRIFAHACQKLGLVPADVWHIGDSLANDVGGAKAAGLTSVWLNRGGSAREAGQPEPDLEIRSLTELVALLGQGA
jgi:putative hydrolase of the HAD superfamily